MRFIHLQVYATQIKYGSGENYLVPSTQRFENSFTPRCTILSGTKLRYNMQYTIINTGHSQPLWVGKPIRKSLKLIGRSLSWGVLEGQASENEQCWDDGSSSDVIVVSAAGDDDEQDEVVDVTDVCRLDRSTSTQSDTVLSITSVKTKQR